MKKCTLGLMAMLLAFQTHAQYGQRTYFVDSLSNESFAKGIRSYNLSGGSVTYAATGTAQPFQAPVPYRARFVRIHQAGNPLFNRMYKVFKSGFEMPNTSNAITEYTNRYTMAGSVQASPVANIPGGSDVLLIKTNLSGVATSPVHHIDIGGGYDEAYCTKNSKKITNRLYTCGESHASNGRAFLMKHDATGAVVSWVRYFDLPCAAGTTGDTRANYLIEDSASGNVCVVGTIQSVNGCRQSFLAKFKGNGTLVWVNIFADAPGLGLDFNSIRATDQPNNYIVTGTVYSLAPTNNRIFLMRVNTAGAAPVVFFSNMLLSNGPSPNYPVDNQYGYDACMRIPPTIASNKEFYVTGMTHYNTGSTDGHIFKCDSNGNPLAAYLYGGNFNDQLNAIDWINSLGTPGDGLATFGKFHNLAVAGTPPKEQSWYIKSYFNLVSGCNEIADNPFVSPVSLTIFPFVPTILSNFINDTATITHVNCLQKKLCWATSLAGGANVRTEAEGSGWMQDQILLYPNPASGNQLTVSFNGTENQTAHFIVIDLTGREVAGFDAVLMKGLNTLEVDLTGLARGTYILQMTSGEKIFHQKFIRQ